MSELQKQLEAVLEGAKERIPADTLQIMGGETASLKASGIEGKAVQNGEKAPDFTLTNHLGDAMNLGEMLQSGPLVVSFYRGGW